MLSSLPKSARWIIVVAILLLLIRLLAPTVATAYVNHKLADLNGYSGQVDDVDIQLWRTAYQLKGFKIDKLDNIIGEPLVYMPTMDIQFDLSSLFSAQASGTLQFLQPELHLAYDPSGEKHQLGLSVPWAELIDLLLPVPFDSVVATNSAITLHRIGSPEADLALSAELASINNAANSAQRIEPRFADVEANGLIMNQAEYRLTAQLVPSLETPQFELEYQHRKLNLALLRDWTRAYLPLDIEQGHMDLSLQATLDGQSFRGVAKPAFQHLSIISWADIKQDNDGLLRLFIESMGGVFTEVLENQSKDQFATTIPFSGTLEQPNIDIWTVIKSTLANIFNTPLNATAQHQQTASDAATPKQKSAKPEPQYHNPRF